MGNRIERQEVKYKIWLIAVLLTGACLSLYYFHMILEIGTIVAHLFYFPIILASIWWKRKGLVVALFSSGFLIFSHVFLRPGVAAYNDYLRAFMFVVTAFVVSELSRRIAKEHEALLAANQQLKAANQQLRANEQQSVREITERKKAESAWQESEGKLSAMLQSIADPMSMMDRDLNIIWANEMAMSIFGDDIVGRKCYEAYHRRNESCEPNPCLTLKVFQDGRIHEHDTQVVDKNGKSRHFHCSANVALRDEQGNPTAVLEISEDITDQKLAEEALRESENSYKAVVENTVEGIVVVQGDTLQYVNPALVSMIGYSEEELLTRPFIEFIHPDHRDWVMGIHIKRLKGEEVPPIYEFKVLDKKGNEKWLENNGILIEWHDRPATLNFLRDITEQKLAEENLKYRIEFEQLITILSKSFIDPGNVHEKINGALKAIGEFANVDRAYVFQLSDDGRTVDNTHEWCAEGIKPQIKNPKGITLDEEMPWFWEKMKANETFHAPAVAELPPEAQLEKKHFEMQDIQALVVVPMLSKGILKGFLGFDSIRSRKTWPEDIITLLRISGESISLALDREHAEQRARLLSSTVEQSNEGMGVIDLQGNLLFLNYAFADMHGYTPEELIGRNLSVFHTPEQMPSVEAANRQVKETGKFDGEIWHVRRDGTVFSCMMHNSLLRDEAGKPIGLIGVLRDVTESKRAEQALKESEERLKILFESAPDTIYLIDSEGRFMDGNNAALELVGFARDEVIGKTLAEIGLLSAGQLSKAEANLKKVATGRLSGPNEYTLKRKDGSHVSIEVRTFPVKIGGKMLSLGIARDITEHKRTEKKILEHQAKLKSLASQLSLTEERERHRLATVLHDQIGQSLVLSKLKLDQLRMSDSGGEVGEALEEVCSRLGRIIQETRTLTFDLSSPNPAEPEPNRGRQKADALTKIPSADKHLLCSHDRNLPPTLFRGREIASSVAQELRGSRRADQICRQIKDDLSPALKQPYMLLIQRLCPQRNP